MKKKKNVFVCTDCGHQHPKWQGFCNSCQARGSLQEQEIGGTQSGDRYKASKRNTPVKRLSETSSVKSDRLKTNISEFNRVMGDGIVKDSLSIITAEPGAGKSTLLLQVSQDVAKQGYKVLYASGEESESQIKQRAERILGDIEEDIWIYSDTNMNNVLGIIEDIDPDVIIIDSIQTFMLEEFDSRPGSPTQTMECANAILKVAKNPNNPRAAFMVGQMTKDNELAGLRALEHLVDTVLILDGENGEELKQLSASKNRYGSTGEIGFFSMEEDGLRDIKNPSEYFMTQRDEAELVSGSALTVIKEGTRPIIVEVESLVSTTFTPYPARIGECMRRDHLNTLVSILEQRAEIELITKNVVIKTTGGIRLKEQSSNLAVIMSIVSSYKDKGIPNDTVFVADIGLTGELKKVPTIETRIKELERMGFKRVFVARDAVRDTSAFKSINVLPCRTLMDVIQKTFIDELPF
ncbi:DNA repair protein RadA [Halobacillus amylolyticus]|uniref:DNA repair protein RadA n=1 Tax=Halobacillus amylolyticus TaxID=2932259 RepID=A0ABY4H8N3_9BACI|nr:DNA repair protein RadA [Halobacillus amylolyticus]UOR10653.1 DNA repair protein RadA [Halobacillus amylolyticus]